MLTALIIAVLAQVNDTPGYPPSRERISRFRFEADNQAAVARCGNGEVGGGGGGCYPPPPSLPAAPSQALYIAPIKGWGVAGGQQPCTGQRPVDASQNILTYARSSTATCIRETDGLGVELAVDEPAVIAMPGAATHFGTLIEDQGTNILLRSYQLDNAAWTSTATVTADIWSGPFSHYRATSGFERLSDTSGVLSQSSCQTVLTTSQVAYAFTCSLRSGTLTTARLTIAGTGNAAGDRTCAITGLDATLSRDDRKGCVTSAYGVGITAITACVVVGAVDADQGTIGAVDCQVEKQGHATSYIETTTAAATRLISSEAAPRTPATLTLSDTAGCTGSELYTFKYDAESFWSLITILSGTGRGPFYFPDTTAKAYDGTNTPTLAIPSVYNTITAASTNWSDAGLTITVAGTGTGTATAYDGTMFGTTITAGAFGVESQTGSMDGVVGNVIADTTVNNCNTQVTMTPVARMGWIGDSLSANVPPGERTPEETFRKASINGTNMAHGGDDFALCAAQWVSGGNGTYDRIMVWCGVNDIIGHDTAGATLEAAEQAWIAEWLYRGIKVYWLDITPFGGYDSTASRLTARNDFNAAQATYCGTAPVGLQCFAVSSLVWDPGNHDNLLAANTTDGLHPTQAMANIVSTAVSAAYIP